ncbi:MAG: diguanylate cyclase [Massilia sp.]
MPIEQAPAPPATGADLAPRGGRLFELIFTSDYKQQRRIRMVLTTALIYLMCIMVLTYGALIGVFEARRVTPLGALCAFTGIFFYIVVRSGLNLRFAQPSLSLPQAMIAQTLALTSYAVSGPAHASALVLLAMIMFYGMFDMGVRGVRLLMSYTIVLTGAVMLWCTRAYPADYPPALEVIYFAFVVTVMPAISSFSVQLSKMRARLRSQREELEQALARLQEVAIHDELTGLVNRRRMLELLGDYVARRARGGPGFAVAMADLDHFKRINDTYGHGVGDEALRSFAREAGSQLRATDTVGRWGGEEFLILLPDTPPGDPAAGIERLRARLAEAPASAQVPTLRIGFSSGLTWYIEGEPIDAMLERTDRALYAAKMAGRSRTVVIDANAAAAQTLPEAPPQELPQELPQSLPQLRH